MAGEGRCRVPPAPPHDLALLTSPSLWRNRAWVFTLEPLKTLMAIRTWKGSGSVLWLLCSPQTEVVFGTERHTWSRVQSQGCL